MKREEKEKGKCSESTNKIHNVFNDSYKKLLHGQKQLLHNIIISQLQIPYKESTIRGYCVKLSKIPEEKRCFFVTLMLGSLIILYNQLIDSWENDISDSKTNIENLSKSLKEFNYGKR